MRKIIFILLAAILMFNVAKAQKISADKVPATVNSAFKAKFPTIKKLSWEKENEEYEANFKLNNEEASANFDNTGNWLETEIEIKVSNLPTAIQSNLKKDFTDYKINETSKIESKINGNCFEVEVEKGEETLDLLFTAEGKFLSKIKEEEKEKKD